MPRLKLDLPDQLPFSTEIAVRIDDINYGGHLGNDALLGIVHEARVRYFASLGFSEREIEGVGIIMTDAAILYRAEGFQGDLLRVEVGIADLQAHGCDVVYRLTAPGRKAEIARVKTGIAFFDYTARAVRPMPPAFRERAVPVDGYRLRVP
jgi:acyl-CoA thioesterase FadM